MNTKKTGAVALSAVALIVLVSGCAGVRGQVDAGSGQSSITSLQSQADTQRRESAELRARQNSVPLEAGKLAANEAIRADKQSSVGIAVGGAAAAKQEAIRLDKQTSVSPRGSAAQAQGQRLAQQAEAMRLDKQQSVTPDVSAAEAQGDRLAKQAEAYRAQLEEDALKRVADEERRAQHPEQQW
ncbi:hypothetical protein LQ757_02340 [Agromyces sp. SYSU K20354]|uniref:hypothetical protein n=1 Tax=Agromyces cavernae TaxID=2898659 RepID=UPI001E628730|nr:hypothetical protein [Agromyces cavernae]MCD2441106.1 hypothetical protein [Agromyces cavernae]